MAAKPPRGGARAAAATGGSRRQPPAAAAALEAPACAPPPSRRPRARGRRWKGIKNYGEVIGFRNRADGDRWDIVAPGLPKELPQGEPLPLSSVIGVVLIKGGNHKLVVELAPPHTPVSREAVKTETREFMRIYSKTHPGTSSARIKFLELGQLDPDAGETLPGVYDPLGAEEQRQDQKPDEGGV